jgi:uncharacterized protein (TIGR02246 family)
MAACCQLSAVGAESDDGDVAAVRDRVESYVSAFNDGDGPALAAHWTEQAEYLHPVTQRSVKGREAIGKAFAEVFEKEPRLRLRVHIDSIRLVDSNIAIEDGKATVLSPDSPPERAAYTVVHVKRDAQWYRASVREIGIPAATQGSDALKDLAWMVGDWRSQRDGSSLQIRCRWTGGGAFLFRSFVDGRVGGTQIIGWDPVVRQIRSWTFDSEGGFSEGVWSWQDDRWVIKASAVMPDGGTGSEQRILVPDGNDRFTWRSVQRQVNGQILPGTDEVVIVRAAKP